MGFALKVKHFYVVRLEVLFYYSVHINFIWKRLFGLTLTDLQLGYCQSARTWQPAVSVDDCASASKNLLWWELDNLLWSWRELILLAYQLKLVDQISWEPDIVPCIYLYLLNCPILLGLGTQLYSDWWNSTRISYITGLCVLIQVRFESYFWFI